MTAPNGTLVRSRSPWPLRGIALGLAVVAVACARIRTAIPPRDSATSTDTWLRSTPTVSALASRATFASARFHGPKEVWRWMSPSSV